MPPKSNLSTIIRGTQGTPLVITDQGDAKVFISNGSSSGLATEATLLSILNNMIASQDVEILLVADDGNGGQIVQQIREYDQGTGAWTTRYEDVNGVAYVPVGPLRYLDASAVLNLLLVELEAFNDKFITEVDDNAIDTNQELPTNINLLYGAYDGEGYEWRRIQIDNQGQLKGIQQILNQLITLNAEDFATETTQLLVKAVLDLIKLDTAGILTNTADIEALLTTIDADTSNIDVLLSTRATEATLLSVLTELQGINLDTNGLSQETTQLLVKGVLDTIDAVLDSIKLDTGAIVIDLAAIEVLIAATNALLTTIDADTSNIATSTANIDTTLTPATRTHNTVSATGVGSVPAGSICGSVINIGNSAGTWNGISLPAGISIPWSQIANRDTYGVIAYDATGTTFIIEYTT